MTSIAPLPHRGPLNFTLDGNRYELPQLPSRRWMDALCLSTPEGQPHQLLAAWWQLIPCGLPERQALHLARRLQSPGDVLDLDQLEKHALTILAAPLGVEFHVAQRLIGAVRSQWMLFDARCASYGLDPLEAPIDRLISIAYALRMEACEKESERKSAQAQLWAPPDGVRASGRSWDDDPDMSAHLDKIESDAFMALFS